MIKTLSELKENDTVLVPTNDGKIIPMQILKFSPSRNFCFVSYEDNSSYEKCKLEWISSNKQFLEKLEENWPINFKAKVEFTPNPS